MKQIIAWGNYGTPLVCYVTNYKFCNSDFWANFYT